MNKDVLQENTKRKISIDSKWVIIGLISLMGVMMTITYVTLVL
ncbi:MAG TPA: hypothetical protein VIS28_05700 [Nitrososphaeraceae archaeon]|jgi:hypothetical protein